MFKKILFIAAISLLTSCNLVHKKSVNNNIIPDSLNNSIKADIKKFYQGNIEAVSVKFDKNDKIIATKTIQINGSWDGDKGIIRQKFIDNNNNKDSRTWLITLENNNNFSAIGHDSVSPAHGIHTGNVIQMSYQLKVPYNDVKTNVNFIDTMYVVNDKSMIKISESFIDNKKIAREIISLVKDEKLK
jgi:hypothetical protein